MPNAKNTTRDAGRRVASRIPSPLRRMIALLEASLQPALGLIPVLVAVLAMGAKTWGEGGAIRGTVRFHGAPAAKDLKVDKDLEVCGKHAMHTEDLQVSKGGGLANVVVQVAGVSGEVPVKKGKERPSLSQKECRFAPHVQVVPAGSRIDILNEDGIAHNVHTLSVDNPSFNLQQPGARKRIVTKKNDFQVPEIIPVKCDIHGWMRAWMVVADHPYYAVTGGEGAFEIEGIPPGVHRVEFWHETLGKMVREVDVKAGHTTEVEVNYESGK